MKSKTLNNGISLLNFDDTLKYQSLHRDYLSEWIDFSDLRSCFGYCSADSLQKIQLRLKFRKHKYITLIGNGNYHYVTYVLLSEIKQPFSLILFDHHTDIASNDDIPLVTCGSWVSMALRTLSELNHVFIIGANPSNSSNFPANVTIFSEQEVNRLSSRNIVRAIRSLLPDQPIYISVDKDVLAQEYAFTNWDHGSMSLPQLLYMIRELKRAYPIIGMDICGELPISPVDIFSDHRVRQLKKNEIANKALIDVLLTERIKFANYRKSPAVGA